MQLYEMSSHKVISSELLLKIKEYAWKKLESYPFDKTVLTELHHISFFYNDHEYTRNIDYDKVVDIIKRVQTLDTRLYNLDEASRALLRIQYGKLMLIAKECLEKYNENLTSESGKRKTWEDVSNILFNTIAKRSERFKLMNIARIPSVESYYFLGITRLKEIEPLVKDSESSDPIGELLVAAGYQFNIDEEFDQDNFISKVKVYANSLKLQQAQVPCTDYEVELITDQQGVITDKFAKKLKRAVNAGQSIPQLLKSSVPSSAIPKTPSVNMAPSYNEFEETILKLSEMVEDILDDNYIPDYSPELTAKWLKVYLQLNSDLVEFWSSKWKDFDRNF